MERQLKKYKNNEQEEMRKKRTANAKSKGKQKCQVCSKQLGAKFTKCEDCFMKYHGDCIKYHECSFKIVEDLDSR